MPSIKSEQQPVFSFEPVSPWVDKIAQYPVPLGTLIFLLTSKIARKVFKRVIIDRSTDTALHPIYEYSSSSDGYSTWDHRWQSSKAAQSLRFRFQWMQYIIKKLLTELMDSNESISAMSLGSGTGLAFVNVLTELQPNSPLLIHFIDSDKRAVARAEQVAHTKGVDQYLEFDHLTSTEALLALGAKQVDLIELVGIAEYVTDEWLNEETRRIFDALKPGGYYIGACISSDDQSEFAHNVLRWPHMNYRSPQELKQVLQAAGFTEIRLQSCGVFESWVARKV